MTVIKKQRKCNACDEVYPAEYVDGKLLNWRCAACIKDPDRKRRAEGTSLLKACKQVMSCESTSVPAGYMKSGGKR